MQDEEEITRQLIRSNEDGSFYVFSVPALRERMQYLRKSLPKDVYICYAVKANPFLIREMKEAADRMEICSPGELNICRELEVPTEKMVISGVYKTPSVIEELCADTDFKGIITAESVQQYEMLCTFSEKYNHSIRVLPRLTNASQFGMNRHELKQILKERKAHPLLEICGIQYFSGTQKTSVKKFRREIEHLDTFLTELREECGFEVRQLEYGTGFAVSYFEGEEYDEDALMAGFSDLIRSMQNKPQVILEIGRGIAASCGRYYTHIVEIKKNRGQGYLLTDGGMHQIVYDGQHMAMQHPKLFVAGKKQKEKTTESWAVCGALCSMNDIMVKEVCLPPVEEGDLICFENAGAYCMQEGMALFLSRDIPPVYLIDENGKIVCLRKRIETSGMNMPMYEEM